LKGFAPGFRADRSADPKLANPNSAIMTDP
jgi:hypothetical protein